MKAVPPPAGLSRWFGIGLIGLGVLLTAASTGTHLATVRRLNRGEAFVGRPTWLGVSTAVLLVIVVMLQSFPDKTSCANCITGSASIPSGVLNARSPM